MTSSRYSGLKAGIALCALTTLSACGGGGGVSSTPTPVAVAPTPTPPPPAPPPPPPPTVTDFNSAEYRNSNAVVQANAITAYQAGATGAGITAAVVDSGVNPSLAEFAGKIHPASADLSGTRGIGDDGGHGTAVSSILLGAKNDSITHGIAFGATLLVARTDTPGSCTNPDPSVGCSHNDNDIARGIDLAVANNARVINISLGGSPANTTLRNAIFRAANAGVVLVFSAGNEFANDPIAGADPDPLAQIANEPGANNMIIIAGALDSTNAALASFSNRAGNGASHYLAALGSRVVSVDETGTAFRFSGTSFSAPAISGAVALLAQAFPNLTGGQIVDLLLRSAVDLGAAGTDTTFGRGALDIGRAFQPQGQASLAGSEIAVSLTGASGIASAAMGDATQTGMSTVILDGYGRAYDVQLGGVSRTGLAPKLAPALGIGSVNRGAGSGDLAVALSVTQSRSGAAVDRLLLSAHERQSARALAGSVMSRLGPGTRLALGISQSANALVKRLGNDRSPAFVVSSAAGDTFGFDHRSGSALALEQALGGFTLATSAETGTVDLWEAEGDARRAVNRYRFQSAGALLARNWGPFNASFGMQNLRERDTVLGAHFAPVLGAMGASSWFADASARWQMASHWQAGFGWHEGWTHIGAGGIRRGSDTLRTREWSVDVARDSLFRRDDSLAIRVAQPLRVTSGSFAVTLPTTYDYASGVTGLAQSRFNLAPTGREIDAEAVYARPLGTGWMSANLYWRREPGNIAAASDDLGAAIRLSFGL